MVFAGSSGLQPLNKHHRKTQPGCQRECLESQLLRHRVTPSKGFRQARQSQVSENQGQQAPGGNSEQYGCDHSPKRYECLF